MTTSTRAGNNRAATTRAPGTGQQSGQRGQSGMGSMLARGGSILAASLLFLLGVYHFFSGIAGFARNNFYTVGSNYPYHTSSHGWGWIHVIGGVLLVLTSLALFSRSTTWARPVAIVLCVASAIANFFFLAYFPLWAILMIALATFCIWALVRDNPAGQGQESHEQRGEQQGFQQYGTQQYATQQYGQPQTGMGSQQNAGAYGTGSYVSAGQNAGQGQGQRWPENAGDNQRGWSPSDMKDSASRLGDKAQEHAQSGARSGQGGQNRNLTDEATDRARQAGRDYRSR